MTGYFSLKHPALPATGFPSHGRFPPGFPPRSLQSWHWPPRRSRDCRRRSRSCCLHTVGDFRGCDGRADGNPVGHPLAKVMISGSTPQCSMPNILPPVRPQAVCTSSQMKRPPYFLTMPTISLKYSFGGVINLRPLYGLRQESGDPPLRRRRLNRFFDVLSAFQVTTGISEPERATVAIGIGNMMDAGNNIWHQPPARLCRKAQRQIGATAIAMAQGDDILALRMDLRQQHRSFVGFRRYW